MSPSPTGRHAALELPRGVGGVVVDVDDAVEEGHRDAHDLAEPVEIEGAYGHAIGGVLVDERAEVDRAEVADRGLVLGR